MSGNPSPGGNVGNGDTVADEEARLGLCELRFHDGVETTSLVDVAVDAVLDLLRCISYIERSVLNMPLSLQREREREKRTVEMICLSLHGTQTTHLPVKLNVHRISHSVLC